MKVSALLVRLYPPAIRRRWGDEIAHEADLAGRRSWPDTAVGAVKLWLHPGDWPETTAGQTSQVLVTAVVAVVTTVVLLLRAAAPVSLTATVDHPATSAWLLPVVSGVALASPLPPLRWVAFNRLVTATFGTLAAPVFAFAVLFSVAHSGLADHPGGALRVLMLGGYWATLGFAGIRLCRLAVRVGRIAVVPGTRRLRLGLLFLGAGLALAAAQTLAVPGGTPPVATAVPACGLAALAAAVLTAGADLRRAPSGKARP